MTRSARSVSVVLAVLIVAACSGAPPEIGGVEIIRVYVNNPATNSVRHQIGLFVSVSDPDGLDDLARLYLIHDESELYWALDPTIWQQASVRGLDWIGSYGLGLPGSEEAPAGEYRVLLEDLSGESAEITERLPAVPKRLPPFPQISEGQDDGLTEVWTFDNQGILLGSIPLSAMDSQRWEAIPEYYLYRRQRDQPLAMATGPISP